MSQFWATLNSLLYISKVSLYFTNLTYFFRQDSAILMICLRFPCAYLTILSLYFQFWKLHLTNLFFLPLIINNKKGNFDILSHTSDFFLAIASLCLTIMTFFIAYILTHSVWSFQSKNTFFWNASLDLVFFSLCCISVWEDWGDVLYLLSTHCIGCWLVVSSILQRLCYPHVLQHWWAFLKVWSDPALHTLFWNNI